MRRQIIILEDNAERRDHMARALADRLKTFEVHFFLTSKSAVEYLQKNLDEAIALSLDHDLEMVPNGDGTCSDPGDGREVADFLSTRAPTCPVLIHSTNTIAVEGMRQVLEDADWTVHRVAPFDDMTWISTAWIRAIRDAIVRYPSSEYAGSPPQVAHRSAS